MITWQNITVGQYQQLYAIMKSEADDFDKELQIVALLSGMTQAEVEALPLDKYKAMKAATLWAFEDIPEGKPIKRFGKYKLIRKVQDLDAGRYISLQGFLQMDMVENLHNLMACIVKPRWRKYNGDNHEQYAEDCRNAPFLALYQTMVFFCKVFNNSMQDLQPFLASQIQTAPNLTKDQKAEQLANLKNTLAGLPMLNE